MSYPQLKQEPEYFSQGEGERAATLAECVRAAVDAYFRDLDGDTPENLYQLVIAEVERPLLESVMDHTGGNQSKAARLLGINRSTLRKKLATYHLD